MKSSNLSRVVLVSAMTALTLSSSPALAKKKPAPPPPAPVRVAVASTPLDRFYSARKDQPLWISNREGQLALVQLLKDSPVDGFARGPELATQIEARLATLNPADAASALATDRVLSQALVDYVQSLYLPVQGMTYGDNWVRAKAPTGETILALAARAPSLADHLKAVSNLNPVYAELRQAALAEAKLPGGGQSARLSLNMSRARFKPPSHKFVLVDIVSARLWMYENGQPVDSMKVVVGQNVTEPQSLQTPMIASVMYYTIFNPYWHVPDHLVRKNIAPAVAKLGPNALKGNKYEVVDSWSATPTILDPATIDWKAVAAGTAQVKLRQKPTGANSMGKMKFPFENGLGIYLHDTPHKEYFAKSDRALSNGCVRLEDAVRFGSWLMGRPARPDATTAELTVAFPQGIPVYMTYLTARPEGGKIAYAKDIYGWDITGPRLASATAAAPATGAQ